MPSKTAPPFIASNLAIDFINTQFGVGEERQECLDDDSSVVAWLQQAGGRATGSHCVTTCATSSPQPNRAGLQTPH